MRVHLRFARLSMVVAAAVIVARCGSSSSPSNPTPTPTPAPTGPAVGAIISGVQSADGTQATQQSGTPPAAQSGGPTVTVQAGTSAVPGGSESVTLTSASSFQSVYISVPGAPGTITTADFDPARAGTLAAANGYYLLRLPTAVTSALVITNFATTLGTGSFQIGYAVANQAGTVGPTAMSNQTTTGSSGSVQVNVSWNTATDVDLHVVDPTQQEIYYGRTQSTNGGSLDVDSNAACSLDNRNSENIRWGSSAPNGTYIVRVDYWASCNVTTATTYTVTVNNGGQRSQFTGTFAASDADAGGAGSGRTITQFTHTTGIAPSSIMRPFWVDPPFAPSPLKLRSSRP